MNTNGIWKCYKNLTRIIFLQALKEKELGNSAYKNKDFESALKHYEEAIKHDPTNMTYISNQAGNYSHKTNFIQYMSVQAHFKMFHL